MMMERPIHRLYRFIKNGRLYLHSIQGTTRIIQARLTAPSMATPLPCIEAHSIPLMD